MLFNEPTLGTIAASGLRIAPARRRVGFSRRYLQFPRVFARLTNSIGRKYGASHVVSYARRDRTASMDRMVGLLAIVGSRCEAGRAP